jgi:hypothetical protein
MSAKLTVAAAIVGLDGDARSGAMLPPFRETA